jgi:hypothetical protein
MQLKPLILIGLLLIAVMPVADAATTTVTTTGQTINLI